MKKDISEKMKNLLLMVPMLHQGGFEKVCVQTARLLKDDYHVTILIFSSKDINYDVSGLDVVDIDVPVRHGKAAKILNVLKRVRKVRRIKKERGIDLSYSFGASANYVNVLSRGREKVLTGLRCSTDMEVANQVRLFCSRSDQVLSCSAEIVRELKQDYHYDRSTVIYNPLDIAAVRKMAAEEIDDFPFPEGTHVISCMARDDRIKALWHLVKAFSLVSGKDSAARLVILGAGRYEALKKLAADLGAADKICFTGVRKNPFPYVAASMLYVLPSNHEGFPNALLEAMALGRPVIAADCKTGPREIVLSREEYEHVLMESPDGSSVRKTIDGTYGVLVPDMDPEPDMDAGSITAEDRLLGEEILRMLQDPQRLSAYGRKAEERAGEFTPERYRETLCAALEAIAAR